MPKTRTPTPDKASKGSKTAPRRVTALCPRRLWGLVRKESYQIFRDPSSILIAFVLPLILIFLSGYAFNLDSTGINVAIVIEEQNPTVTSLAKRFDQSESFNVTFFRHRDAVSQQIADGKYRGMVVIPQDFTRRFLDQEPSTVQIIVDGSEPNIAGLIQGYVSNTLNLWLVAQQNDQNKTHPIPITLNQRIWFNENATSRHSIIPGTIVIILTVIGTLLTALVIAREWERGTMEALFVTPVSMLEIILGKMIPYYILGIGSLCLSFLSSTLVFQVPFRGSLLALFCICSLYLFATLALGLMISKTARNQFVASQTAIYVAFLPAFFLSGFIFELNSMPKILQYVSFVLPPRYLVSSLKSLFLTGTVPEILVWNALGILAFTGGMFIIIFKGLRKSLEP